jgi:membrane-anchored protein YejM (alkaline phosphatase superfamily)
MFKDFKFSTETTWYLVFGLANGLIAAILCINNIPNNTLLWSIQSLIFGVFASIGHFTFLFLFASFPGWLLTKTHKNLKNIGLTLILISNTLLIILIYLNFRVFELYKFHLNGMILELLTGGALQDILSFNFLVWLLIASIAIALIGLEIFATRALYKALYKSNSKNLIVTAALSLFITSALISQSIYVISDAKGDTTITNIKRYIPWAQTITAKRKLRKLGVEVAESEKNQLNYQISDLNYPKQTLECTAETPPNIVLIVVDSLRYDMLTKEVMPNSKSFANKSHLYKKHYSLANSTRFGLFTLMYGLPGNYWHSMLGSQTSSIFIDQLLEKNYQLHIHAAAPLYSPEFDRTIFSRVKDQLNIGPKNEPAHIKDKHITKEFITKLDTQKKDEPFFGFLFYDSPHSYSYPKSWKETFKPSWDKINYLELNNDFDPEQFLNRYKNSVSYTDSLIGDVINKLKSTQLLDNTVIILTSDHGQEFNETKRNFWGHNGNFSKYQTQVPLFIYWPDSMTLHGQEIYQQQTASVDIVPTILSNALNCQNPISDYSTGLDLYKPNNNYDRPLLLESWSKRAIMGKDYIFVSLDTGGNEMFDRNYNELPELKTPQEDITFIFKEMSQFKK